MIETLSIITNVDGFNIISINEIHRYVLRLENISTHEIYEEHFNRSYLLYPFQTITAMYNFIAHPSKNTQFEVLKIEPEHKLIFRIVQKSGITYDIKLKKLI